MRGQFHEHLDTLVTDLERLTLIVETAMGRATAALLDADVKLADEVARDASAATALSEEMQTRAVDLVARQQPVAGDLRIVVGALRMMADLERMGALAQHVADIARRYAPRSAVPEPLRETIARMGVVAEQITADTRRAIGTRDWTAADALNHADDEMDGLLTSLYQHMLHGGLGHATEAAVDLALLGRYYERYADHAVSVARRVAYLAGHGPLDARERSARRAADLADSPGT